MGDINLHLLDILVTIVTNGDDLIQPMVLGFLFLILFKREFGKHLGHRVRDNVLCDILKTVLDEGYHNVVSLIIFSDLLIDHFHIKWTALTLFVKYVIRYHELLIELIRLDDKLDCIIVCILNLLPLD